MKPPFFYCRAKYGRNSLTHSAELPSAFVTFESRSATLCSVPDVGAKMSRVALLNPFELTPESAKGFRAVTPAQRSVPICSGCGSDDVLCRATIQWSIEAQEWQLTSTFGQPAYCNSCSADCGIVWHVLN
jgi:hypothetical protein